MSKSDATTPAQLAPVALVLAAHGDRGGERSNAALLAHAETLRATFPGMIVTAGVLKGTPSIEDALAAAAQSQAPRILLYPYFMADGYFVRTVLPKRIAAAGLEGRVAILPPLGIDPGLPRLLLAEATTQAGAGAIDPPSSRLLIVAHGSEVSRASFEATEQVASELRDISPFAEVSTAYLEEPPFLADALAASKRPTVVAGLFSGDGLHGREDVHEALAASGIDAVYTGPIGALPSVARLIAATIAAHRRPA